MDHDVEESVGAEYGHIVRFASPPVTEVVAAVHFQALSFATAMRLGQLHQEQFAEEFPIIEPQVPLPSRVEDFDEVAGEQQFQVQFGANAEPPRVWFIDETGDRVVQVQSNWFACNWRNVRAESTYQQWERRREDFRAQWESFSSWVAACGDEVVPVQCEVTYINHIETPDHANLPQIFHVDTPVATGLRLQERRIQDRYVILDNNNDAVGRLTTSIQPGFKQPDMMPVYAFELTARTSSSAGVLRGLDVGRNSIVTQFLSMTTPEAREGWGQA